MGASPLPTPQAQGRAGGRGRERAQAVSPSGVELLGHGVAEASVRALSPTTDAIGTLRQCAQGAERLRSHPWTLGLWKPHFSHLSDGDIHRTQPLGVVAGSK